MKDLNFIEKTAFGYSSNFQDKKKIAELRKEIELLKEEQERERRLDNEDNIKVISTAEDFSQLICERLLLSDKIKLVTLLNQDIKKQQSHVKNKDDNLDKTEYIAKQIFKSKDDDKPLKIIDFHTQVQNLRKQRVLLDEELGLTTDTKRQNVRTRYNNRGERYLNEHPQKELLSEWIRICVECRRLDSIIKEMSAIEKAEEQAKQKQTEKQKTAQEPEKPQVKKLKLEQPKKQSSEKEPVKIIIKPKRRIIIKPE